MIDANDSSTSRTEPEFDPTLSSLVPQRSPGRSILLIGFALLGVIGLWTSHGVLRPTVVSGSGGAMWTALPTHDQVATVVLLDPSRWSRDLRSVTDVPGAQVAGTWLFPIEEIDIDNTVVPADYADGFAYLEAAFPAREFGDNSQLPQRIPRNGPSQLVVLWNITNCAALDAGPAPQAVLSTWLGTTTRQSFDEFVRPGFDMPTLTEAGICP
jgi:hypothetical protein